MVTLASPPPPSPSQLSSHSLQLIFTDGEEAFRTWSDTDSIYGARQLAADMEQPSDDGLLGVSGKTALEAMVSQGSARTCTLYI